MRYFVSVVFLLTCSCATNSDWWYPDVALRPDLPSEVSFNKEAGRGGQLMLTLRSDGGEDWVFMLDTGSPTTFLDKSLEPKLGKRLQSKRLAYGWLGERIVGVYASPCLYLGDTALLMGSEVYTDDLSLMAGGNRIQGILGMDCLRHYCLQLDFVANKLRFLDREHLKKQELGQAFRLRLTSANITIQGTFVEATNAPIGIDTAAYDDGSLGAKLFQKAVSKQDNIFIKEWNNSSGTRTRQARFWQGVFGDEVFSDLVLMECPSGENFLGLRFLARHLVTFDFPGRTIYLKRMRTDPVR